MNFKNKVFAGIILILLMVSAGLMIYYPGRWLERFIDNGLLKMSFQFVLIMIVLGVVGVSVKQGKTPNSRIVKPRPV